MYITYSYTYIHTPVLDYKIRMSSFFPQGRKVRATVSLVLVGTLGAIWYSHVSQVRERESMKAGIARDKERIRNERRKRKQTEP